jgi:hypothetical protein
MAKLSSFDRMNKILAFDPQSYRPLPGRCRHTGAAAVCERAFLSVDFASSGLGQIGGRLDQCGSIR